MAVLWSFWNEWRYTLKRARLQGKYESVSSESLHLLEESIKKFFSQIHVESCILHLHNWSVYTHTIQTHLLYKALRSKLLSARYSSERPRSINTDSGSLKPSSARRPRLYHPCGRTVWLTHTYGHGQLWINTKNTHTARKSIKEANLWVVPLCCQCVHLCCRKQVFLLVTLPLIQQVTHSNQSWNRVRR